MLVQLRYAEAATADRPVPRLTFLVPKGKIHIHGTLELSIYQDKINLGCRVEEISEWVRQDA